MRGLCSGAMRLLAYAAAVVSASAAFGGAKIDIDDTRWVSVGAGMRSAFTSVQDGAPNGNDYSKDFNVQSVRLYINGQAHEKVKFTFNTECESCVFGQDANDPVGASGDLEILDVIAQFELSDAFNVWMGRMLVPANRIEMNGPYYGLSWNQFTVPLLPSDQLGRAGLLGRDDGVTAWGKLGKFQYAVGIFDGVGGGPNQEDNLMFAGRFAYNFLEMEQNPGYYTSSTYFGELGDIFTLAVSFNTQQDGAGTAASPGDFKSVTFDALFEKVLGNDGVITLEGEYKIFDTDISTAAAADPSCFCLFDGDAYFATAAYLLPTELWQGRLQPYIRYTSNNPDNASDSDLTELGLNYIIRGHNLKLNLNYTDGDANLTGLPGSDVKAFSLGVQVQI